MQSEGRDSLVVRANRSASWKDNYKTQTRVRQACRSRSARKHDNRDIVHYNSLREEDVDGGIVSYMTSFWGNIAKGG